MAMTDLIPWKRNDNNRALTRQATDPFALLRQEIDQMFNGVVGDWTGRSMFNPNMPAFMPNVDVKETAKEIRVTAELPGLDEKDLEVSLLDGLLSIKGEKREEHEEEKGETYRSERQYGAFQRTIQLPAEVDANRVKASFKRGVLNVVLPKTKEAHPNRRVIRIEG